MTDFEEPGQIDSFLMYCSTVQASSIKILFDSLKDILNDVNLFFSEGGIKMQAMDGAHAALVFLKLTADKFEKFHCPNRIVTGVNMSSVSKLIKTVSTTDIITFSMIGSDRLTITITNSQKKSVSRSVLNLLDINEDTYEIPDVKYDSVIQMPSNDLQKICRDLSNIGDVVKITSRESVLEFSSEGDFASQSVTIGDTTDGLIHTTNGSPVSENFSLKFMNMFTKSSSLSQTVEMYLKKDTPMILVYKVGNLGRVQYALAPKVDLD